MPLESTCAAAQKTSKSAYAPNETRKIIDKIIHYFKPGQVEVIMDNSSSALTRYADNIITQNVSENNLLGVIVRVINNGKVARVMLNQVNDASLKRAARNCRYFVTAQGTEFGLLGKQEYTPVNAHNQQTADITPTERAIGIKEAVLEASHNSLNISGIFSNDASALTIANSKGLFAHYASTSAEFTCTAMTPDSSGKATKTSRFYTRIKPAQIAKLAIDKAVKSKNPVDIKAGAYTVILEPAAAVELLFFLAFRGFGALSYQEGRSFLAGKLGKKIMGNNISIVENAYHPDILGMPFDFEGMPRKKVVLVDKGVACNVVHDRLTAKKAKCASTGHALPQPNASGPIPTNLVFLPGNSSLEEMISSTDRGILVSEFHYTNVLDPMKMTITGMTRNGTFLIENGVITKGVKNMRFTDSVLNMLSNVELISRQTELRSGFFGGSGFVTPALKIGNFNFSSETKF
ncbi:MAG: TldD/PmbA family protein [Planctomycetes bacterium]|nr:TldD/PmbA family protein [Planctomycetota bacterium]